MTKANEQWSVFLMAAAETELRDIVDWTFEKFGPRQALVYAETIIEVIRILHDAMDLRRHLVLPA